MPVGEDNYKQLISSLQEKHKLATNIFWMALDCYAEAVKCFDNNIIEAAMVMCRNSLDSAIVEALLKKISENPIVNAADWDSRNLFGSNEDFFSVWLRTGDNKARRLLEEYALAKIKGIQWGRLRQLAKNILGLDRDTIEEISKVREHGNYSAHRAQNIIKSSIESMRTQQDVKIITKPEEAKLTIEKTRELLEKIATKYLEAGH